MTGSSGGRAGATVAGAAAVTEAAATDRSAAVAAVGAAPMPQTAAGVSVGSEEDTRTAFPICPLCEAGCGLEIDSRTTTPVVRIRGNRDDVFSHGFICPKGSTLKQLHEDPDRLRSSDGPPGRPARRGHLGRGVRRRSSGGCSSVIADHGREALAVYIGNPTAHNLASADVPPARAAGPRDPQPCSARRPSTRPRSRWRSATLFGTPGQRAGARPRPHRLPAHARGQPVRVERQPVHGARLPRSARGDAGPRRAPGRRRPPAQPHGARPPTSGFPSGPAPTPTCSWAWCTCCSRRASSTRAPTSRRGSRGSTSWPRARRAVHARGRRRGSCGIEADTIRRLARELADAPTAAVYGRIGTCTQAFGTTASWLVDALNLLTGNLDRPGGAMFALPAAGGPTTRGAPGSRQRLPDRPRPHPGPRAARGDGGVPGGSVGGGDRDAGRRPDQSARHRWPATRSAPRRTRRGSTPPSRGSTSW